MNDFTCTARERKMLVTVDVSHHNWANLLLLLLLPLSSSS
jgi:hypothetical protein